MNTLFEKIKQAIKDDFYDVAERQKQANPISLLNQYLRESEAEVKKAAKLIERQKLLRDEFYKEWQHVDKMAEKRKEQGEIALKAGAEDLSEIALREQAEYEERAERLKLAYNNSVNQLEELEYKYREMKLKLKDMHMKRLELMGQENVVLMKNKMNRVLKETEFGIPAENMESVGKLFEREEKKANDEYEISIFDARIQQLAKEMNKQDTGELRDNS
ncbi:MAG TPA: modulator protein [Bacillus bacterium]|uniref:Phage shock protein A n=1 Tax=Siminovitchia fordii TaxID=254759 RepID=A0ABQ4JZZ4_9BACI|nr:PspA/IM30 family protein [Siminovitchia fordii]GIN19103.1 phage shock protein A [Siminovitchia fordii]HBZ10282.1 modulator protein [Bacillus sp. (in: firmicutes)]